jgi:carbamoyl-phosphate synthase large subunit
MRRRKYRIFTEASGSLTSAFIIKAIQNSKNFCCASDLEKLALGSFLADDFAVMPSIQDPELWQKTELILKEKKIDFVLPSLDESLMGWAERKEYFAEQNVNIICSPPETMRICLDKWETYLFFVTHGIPCPKTSLDQMHPLVKPRKGRGGDGILLTDSPVDMTGMISQEFVEGDEFTIDVLCDLSGSPIYIIPRRRIRILQGKAIESQVDLVPEIVRWAENICSRLKFVGPINFQCILTKRNEILFIEINPRIASGMALGFAASENWIKLLIERICASKAIKPKKIKNGLRMQRYYAEQFIS